MAAKLGFNITNNMAEYEACILGLKMAMDINVYELVVAPVSCQLQWNWDKNFEKGLKISL